MEKFTELGLSVELTDVLKRFGFKEPSKIQEKAIPIALAGRDIIGGSATGSGKTLAFASPIIENLKKNMNIQALILTPTRELAEQVATSIRDFGENKKLNVLAVYGGVKIEPQIRKLSTADVLVGTPGRILDHIDRRTLNLTHVKFLVLDEVDRMFDMGFRTDVERIINECPKKRQTMMFSATISQGIDYLSKKYTKDPVEISVKPHVDPSKLKQVYYDVPDNKKFSLLVGLLKKENADLVMVFCNTRRNVDFIADNLIMAGIHAKAIHGKIEQKKRIRVLDEFHKKGIGVLVCTDVAARGLDIKGVSHVYNYDVSIEPKDYIHRIGRTARAGKEGKAITILASRDYEKFSALMQLGGVKITREELPYIENIRIRMDSKENYNQKRDFSRGYSGRGSSNKGQNFGRSDSRRDGRFNRGSGNRGFSRGSRGDGSRSNGLKRNERNRRDRPRRNFGRDSMNSSHRGDSGGGSRSESSNRPRSSNKNSYKRSNSRRPLNKRRNNVRDSNRYRG